MPDSINMEELLAKLGTEGEPVTVADQLLLESQQKMAEVLVGYGKNSKENWDGQYAFNLQVAERVNQLESQLASLERKIANIEGCGPITH